MFYTILTLYLVSIIIVIVFVGLSLYRNRKSVYIIKRVDFPIGLTASEKHEFLENYIEENEIIDIRNIFVDISTCRLEISLTQTAWVYLDYVV
jgi:hypothetical protein